MREIKAPEHVVGLLTPKASIFLAGTIDNGNSADWQANMVASLADIPDLDIYNPRRNNWDSTWKQDYSSPKFKGQVDWELEKIEFSDIVFFYIGKDSKSPISLMELGLVATSEDQIVIVFCEDGFYRKGNVDAICTRYELIQVNSWEEAVSLINSIQKGYWE